MTDFNNLAQQWATTSGFNAAAAANGGANGSKVEWWSPKNGDTVLRILPPGKNGCKLFQEGMWGIRQFRYEVWGNGPFTNFTGDKPLIATCGNRTLPAEFFSDPVKEALTRNDAYLPNEVSDKFYARNKVLVNVMIREIRDERNNVIDQDLCNKPVVASLPTRFWNFLTDPNNVAHFNPFNGLDIRVSRRGKGLTTEYSYAFLPGVAPGPVVADQNQMMGLLDQVEDLYDLVKSQIEKSQDNEKSIIALIDNLAQINKDKVSSNFGSPAAPAAPATPTFAAPPAPAAPAAPAPAPAPAPMTPPPAPAPAPEQQERIGFTPAFAPTPAPAPAPAPAPEQAAAPAPAPAADAAAPECMGQFEARNPGASMAAPSDADCQACPSKTVCYFQSKSPF